MSSAFALQFAFYLRFGGHIIEFSLRLTKISQSDHRWLFHDLLTTRENVLDGRNVFLYGV